MQDAGPAEQNPFSSQTVLDATRQNKQLEKEHMRAYFGLPIAEKTRMQQLASKRDITVGTLRREDQQMFGTINPADAHNFAQTVPEDILPEAFRSSRRQGVKQFIERTRMLCRLASDCSMKEEEIRSINAAAIARCAELERSELQLNRRELEIERQLREMEELSIKGQKDDELSNFKLDQIRRKADELNSVLASIFQEIERQTECLQLAIRARDMIETVASLGGEDFAPLRRRRAEIERFFAQHGGDDELLTSRPPQILAQKPSPVIKGAKQPKEQPKPIQADDLFPLRTQAVLALARRYVRFSGSLSLQEVEQKLEVQPQRLQRFEIDFDFAAFVAQIQSGFDKKISPRSPLTAQQPERGESRLVRNVDSRRLVREPFNAFEQLYGVECDARLMRAVNSLVASYDYPPVVPFERFQDFSNNLRLLEETTLVRTQNLQELRHMTDGQQNALQQSMESSSVQERALEGQFAELSARIMQYQYKTRGFDKERATNSTDAFIYDLDKYASADELQVDKQSDELDFLHQCIAQAAVFSGSIDADDCSSISNNILARMELVLNQTMADIYQFSQQQVKEARYVLDKKRREVARNAKMSEMMKQNEKQNERRKIREERYNKTKLVARQVVGKCFLADKKKTQVQIELEERLKKEQMQGAGDEGDFYQ